MDRRRLGSRLSERRSRTPYERPPTTPSRETVSSRPSTPGSIFSKVRDMFTPSRLWSRQTPSVADSDDLQSITGTITEGTSTRSIANVSDDGKFTYPPPLPAPRPNLGKFDHSTDNESIDYGRSLTSLSSIAYPHGNSPNEKLKEFFRAKGDEKLSDVEVAGVMALIQQASHRNESLLDHYSASVASERAISTINSGTVSPSFEDLSGGTPLRGDMGRATPPVPSPRYTPLYSRSSASSRNLGTPSESSKVRKAFHYNNIPTPYRPGLKRSLGSLITEPQLTEGKGSASQERRRPPSDLSLRSESFKSESTIEDVDIDVSSISTSTERGEKSLDEHSEKPLSHTASALLSLLDTNDNAGQSEKLEKRKEEKIPQEIKKFVSPYAARPRLSTPRKQLSSRQSEPSLRSPAVRELEMSRPKETNAFQYKPAKSSSLRQSLIASPEKDSPEPIEVDGDFPKDSPNVLFSFQPTDDTTLKSGVEQDKKEVTSLDSKFGSKPLKKNGDPQKMQVSTGEVSGNNIGVTSAMSVVPTSTKTQSELKSSSSLETPVTSNSTYPDIFGLSPAKPLFASVETASPQIETSSGESPPSTKDAPFSFGVSIKTTTSETASINTAASPFSWPDVPVVDARPLTPEEETQVKWLRENVYRF
jgi:hypothetical protein